MKQLGKINLIPLKDLLTLNRCGHAYCHVLVRQQFACGTIRIYGHCACNPAVRSASINSPHADVRQYNTIHLFTHIMHTS